MTDVETLSERVRTVERAVTEGDHTFPEVDDLAELTERIEVIERRLDELDERATELEGATQALRGYVGNVRSVNERVEQRADTALAATERLERRLEADDEGSSAQGQELNSEPSVDHTARADDSPTEHSAGHSTETAGHTAESAGHTNETARLRTETSEFEFGSSDPLEPTEPQSTDEAEASDDAGVLERIRSLL